MAVSMRPPARLMVWLLMGYLAGALLLAQTLGLLHGVVHEAGREHHVQALSVDQVHNHGHNHSHGDQGAHSGGWLASLFSSHDGGADCRLFDQASHGSAAPASALSSLPALPPSVAVAIFQGDALARWVALFDARGPPLTH